jgi:uncharacterized iron-regulated protein
LNQSQRARSRTSLDRIGEGRWFDVRRGRNRDDAVAELATKTVVLLGENHDDPAHHQWQLETISSLFRRQPRLVLGFEMFPRRVQPVLERWSCGELDESTFLSEVDWPRVWGFDPELYLPLFRFAQTNRLPVVALNVDRETNRRVAGEGFAIPLAQREGVGEPAPASSAYRDRLTAWFSQHPGAATDPARFERFVRAQTFWDRAMAEALVKALRELGRPLIIGIMGRGHIEYGDGVPRQLAALGQGDVAAVLPWPAGAEAPPSEPRIADFLFGVASPQDTTGSDGES